MNNNIEKLLKNCPTFRAKFENSAQPPTVEERLQAVESVIADIMIMQIGGESDV